MESWTQPGVHVESNTFFKISPWNPGGVWVESMESRWNPSEICRSDYSDVIGTTWRTSCETFHKRDEQWLGVTSLLPLCRLRRGPLCLCPYFLCGIISPLINLGIVLSTGPFYIYCFFFSILPFLTMILPCITWQLLWIAHYWILLVSPLQYQDKLSLRHPCALAHWLELLNSYVPRIMLFLLPFFLPYSQLCLYTIYS
jgi:hypothetical protein